MILEARPENCCSTKFVLKLDGRPVGKYEGRWFSECLNIHLLERRHLELRKLSWLGSKFELIDLAIGQAIGRCDRSGLFTRSWDMTLSVGPAVLVRAGWLTSAFELKQGDQVLARVDRLGWCERGWSAENQLPLAEEDLLFLGVLYHIILQREEAHAAQAGSAGS
jgi:hypothetical protein